MGRTFGTVAVTGLGVFLAAILVLATVATVVGIVLAVVTTVVSAIVSLTVLAVFALAAYGLVSILGAGDVDESADAGSDIDDRDPVEHLQERYVAGEVDEIEFERRMELLLDSPGDAGGIDGRLSTDDGADRLRDRLRDW